MNRYQQLTQNVSYSESFNQELMDILLKHHQHNSYQGLSWEDLYWISKHLFLHDDSGASDNPVINALEYAHARGMNLRNNRELYLDGVMMLAAKHLKYGQYFRTINYITELRDNGGDLPDWVHIYYCVAMTYAYPRQVIANPSSIISSLRKITMEDKDTRRRTQAAVKRYLDLGAELLDDPGLRISAEHLNALYKVLKEYAFDKLPEWELFIHRAMGENSRIYLPEHEDEEESPKFPTELSVQVDALREENQCLQKKIQLLEERLAQLLDAGEGVAAQQEAPAEEMFAPALTPQTEHLVTARRKRLLVFGDSRVTVDKLRRYANAIGFQAVNIDFYLDYARNERFNLNIIQYHSPYIGILIGPNAHKAVNLGDYPSMISKLRNEPGFPHSIEIRTLAGELKITKTSFEAALMRMIDHMDAIGA